MKNYFLIFVSVFSVLIFNACQNKTDSEVSGTTHLINVKDLGAKGDGEAYDSYPIQAAIDSISKLGGGTVYIPREITLLNLFKAKHTLCDLQVAMLLYLIL